MDEAAWRGELGEKDAHRRRREVDENVGTVEGGFRVVTDRHAEVAGTGNLAGVAADGRRARTIERRVEDEPRRGGNGTHIGGAHAAAGSGHDDA
jgi:hypothetical protein